MNSHTSSTSHSSRCRVAHTFKSYFLESTLIGFDNEEMVGSECKAEAGWYK